METEVVKMHINCARCTATDVFKGLCSKNGIMKASVILDAEGCKEWTPAAICRFCVHYVPKIEDEGECRGFSELAIAYPTMPAKTCENFEPTKDTLTVK